MVAIFGKLGFKMQKQELVSSRYNWFSLYNNIFSMERMQPNLGWCNTCSKGTVQIVLFKLFLENPKPGMGGGGMGSFKS